PCLLQMSIVLVTAVSGIAAGAASRPAGPALWRQGLVFAAGFLGVYTAAAVGIGLAGPALARYAVVFKAPGGAPGPVVGAAGVRGCWCWGWWCCECCPAAP